MMREKELTLSFCITCKNRLKQIKETLPQNLKDNENAKNRVEFVIVDFGSTDGLQKWIKKNFVSEIKAGYLNYYYTEELTEWHASIAKNTSHILAKNEILVSLDCDNFTGKNGGLFVLNNMLKFGYFTVALHQFSNEFGDGSYGRIAISKDNFIRVGGYDESLEPMGYQDVDFLLRLRLMGITYIHLIDKDYNKTIPNTKEEGLIHTNSNRNWVAMNFRNYRKSTQNITSGKIVANKDKDHIGIIDKIYTF